MVIRTVGSLTPAQRRALTRELVVLVYNAHRQEAEKQAVPASTAGAAASAAHPQ